MIRVHSSTSDYLLQLQILAPSLRKLGNAILKIPPEYLPIVTIRHLCGIEIVACKICWEAYRLATKPARLLNVPCSLLRPHMRNSRDAHKLCIASPGLKSALHLPADSQPKLSANRLADWYEEDAIIMLRSQNAPAFGPLRWHCKA